MPEPTTTRELEDWHARRTGWTKSIEDSLWHHDGDVGSFVREGMINHPIAPTIDAAVLAMPEGWVWERGNGGYVAFKTRDTDTAVFVEHETGDTPEAIRRDLLALARLAWIAEGATP